MQAMMAHTCGPGAQNPKVEYWGHRSGVEGLPEECRALGQSLGPTETS